MGANLCLSDAIARIVSRARQVEKFYWNLNYSVWTCLEDELHQNGGDGRTNYVETGGVNLRLNDAIGRSSTSCDILCSAQILKQEHTDKKCTNNFGT